LSLLQELQVYLLVWIAFFSYLNQNYGSLMSW
jgi:hypothetical protein